MAAVDRFIQVIENDSKCTRPVSRRRESLDVCRTTLSMRREERPT